MKPKHFSHTVPFLPVKDLEETIQYYKQKLGFYNEWLWGETDAGLERDNMHLLFNSSPEFTAHINNEHHGFEVMWFVQGIDAIYEEYKSKGVAIRMELEDKPWGTREFHISDINGYIIRIAEGIVKQDPIES